MAPLMDRRGGPAVALKGKPGRQANAETETLLFVYGTLLTHANHPLGEIMRENAERIARGSFRGRLYIIPDPDEPGNEYPGAVPSGDPADRVHGEVYRLLGDVPRLLGVLDRFEACSPDRPEPHEFLRRRVDVMLEDGSTLTASAYLYTWDLSRARLVPDGRYAGDLVDVR